MDDLTAELELRPDVARSLSTEHAAALLAAVRAARQAQRDELAKAIDEALTHVPAVLRGAVRRILF